MIAHPMHASPTATLPPTLPIVVQVGFAGSRRLFATPDPGVQRSRQWEDLLLPQLIDRLQTLPQRLGLGRQHLLCGVSQLAVGADTLFTLACQSMGIPQRLLLPLPGDAFLAAGSGGQPDFSAEDRQRAGHLMTSAHIAELRVASTADDRGDRFDDTNTMIVRESDVVVCLLREGATGRPGGTHELMRRARAAGKPVFSLEVLLQDGQPVRRPGSTAPRAATLSSHPACRPSCGTSTFQHPSLARCLTRRRTSTPCVAFPARRRAVIAATFGALPSPSS
jgi:hypothetical protein